MNAPEENSDLLAKSRLARDAVAPVSTIPPSVAVEVSNDALPNGLGVQETYVSAEPKHASDSPGPCAIKPDPLVSNPGIGSGSTASGFWKTVKDGWVPALACVGLGWLLSYKDTQTQLHWLETANEKLQDQKTQLRDQNAMLHQQTGLLKDQNKSLLEQKGTLASILQSVADNNGKLARDPQGNITLQGKAIINSTGSLLVTEKGQVITTDSGIPLLGDPSPKKQ